MPTVTFTPGDLPANNLYIQGSVAPPPPPPPPPRDITVFSTEESLSANDTDGGVADLYARDNVTGELFFLTQGIRDDALMSVEGFAPDRSSVEIRYVYETGEFDEYIIVQNRLFSFDNGQAYSIGQGYGNRVEYRNGGRVVLFHGQFGAVYDRGLDPGLGFIDLVNNRYKAFQNVKDGDVSDDGRYFVYSDIRLRPGDGQIQLYDAATGQTKVVSTSAAGYSADRSAYQPDISADGRWLVFRSAATNLVAGDRNNRQDVFLKDLVTGEIRIISNRPTGQSAGDSEAPAFVDGSIRFSSEDLGLIPGSDASLFYYDLRPQARLYLTVATDADSMSFQASADQAAQAVRITNGQAVITSGYAVDGDYSARLTATRTGEADTVIPIDVRIRADATAGVNLTGGSGMDFMILSGHDDVASGGGGDDIIQGRAGNDTLRGGAGVDQVQGGDGDDVLSGEGGGDRLSGGAGADQLSGGVGNDILDGGAGADRMDGGSGDDRYVVDDAGDQVVEAADGGYDTILSSVSLTLIDGVERLELQGPADLTGTGNVLDNVIIGNSGANVLTGLFGDDYLDGGAGRDRLIGGFGDDTYVIDNSRDVIVEKANEGIDTVRTWIDFTLASTLEHIFLLGAAHLNATGNDAANQMTGNAGNNELLGGKGDDILSGGDGDDILNGGTGADKMIGGAGDDTYVFGVGDYIREEVDGGIDTVLTGHNFTLGFTLENVTLITNLAINATGNALGNVMRGNFAANILQGLGGADDIYGDAGDDFLYGGDDGDRLFGGDGLDRLEGGAGNDVLDGGAGADILIGGAGDDTYMIDASDTIQESADGGVDTIQYSLSYTLGAFFENLILTGTARAAGTGNDLANVILGNDETNTLIGLGGDDRLEGGGGNDTLSGGEGLDILIGGRGKDTFIYSPGDILVEELDAGTDTVQSAYDVTLAANIENLDLTASNITGVGNELANVITGGSGAQTLRGLAGNDTLQAGPGNDVLEGGLGADTLSGGTGADRFQYLAANEGGDTIARFAAGEDQFWFSAAGFGADGQSGTVGADWLVSGTGAVADQAHGQFLYDPTTGILSWDADGTGAGFAVVIAGIVDKPGLTASDLHWF